jgi:mono/diheme cytochrome c family protein
MRPRLNVLRIISGIAPKCRAASARLLAFGLAFLIAAPAAAQAPEQMVERGGYIVENVAVCGHCHTPQRLENDVQVFIPGMHLAGGYVSNNFAGRTVGPNITQDPETGIGRWTDAQIATAIREGRRPDGSLIGPPMPIVVYRQISDADVAAMVAYLRTVPPVRNVVEKSVYQIPLPATWGPPVANVPPPEDSPVARGAYLAGPIAHCTVCHTPATPTGGFDWSRTGAGGRLISTLAGPIGSRNITPHPEAGIGRWTDAQIIRAIREGISSDERRLAPPMPFGSYAGMHESDLADLVAYLHSLPPAE